MKFPAFLKPGSKIAVVSTALKVTPAELQPGLDWIRAQGWIPVVRDALFAEWFRFAGDDSHRLAELQRAMDDPETDAIWFARGGYGTIPLLDRLHWAGFLHSPKWLIGFSDLTALLLEAVHRSVVCLHAPVLVSFPEITDSVKQTLAAYLTGQLNPVILPAAANIDPVVCSGMLWGGNLSLVVNSIGRIPKPEKILLFLEEVDEYVYHIDRMCWQLKYAGYFEETNACLLGGFTQIKDNEVRFGKTLSEIVHEKRKPGCPVLFGFPAGHQPENHPIFLGATATVQISPSETVLSWQT